MHKETIISCVSSSLSLHCESSVYTKIKRKRRFWIIMQFNLFFKHFLKIWIQFSLIQSIQFNLIQSILKICYTFTIQDNFLLKMCIECFNYFRKKRFVEEFCFILTVLVISRVYILELTIWVMSFLQLWPLISTCKRERSYRESL